LLPPARACILSRVPRPPRDIAAGIFHVYTHCVWAAPKHFHDDVDRTAFLRELARVTVNAEWKCIAFCLMRSHYHLIVEVEDGVLPRAMQSLNWRYAMHFNTRHAMRGVTQFTRYGARRLEGGDSVAHCFRYVARNPVEAGLCRRPQEWLWSSYAGTVDLAKPHSFIDARAVLAYFSEIIEVAIARLRAYVEDS
jgi:putative transposase